MEKFVDMVSFDPKVSSRLPPFIRRLHLELIAVLSLLAQVAKEDSSAVFLQVVLFVYSSVTPR